MALWGALPHRRRRWMRASAALTVLALLAGGGIGALSHELADRLIHPPRDVPDVDPADRGLAFERVGFASTDGVPLVGWWMPADCAAAATVVAATVAAAAVGCPSAPVVVFLHGYGASKAQSLSVAPFLHRAGYAVLAFDFRAHGESGGAYTTVGIEEVRDVDAAVAWLRDRPDADASRVALLGWSMGAAAGIHAAQDLPEVRAIVADSAFARLQNVVAHSLSSFTGLPYQPFGSLGILIASWKVHRSVGENEPQAAVAHLGKPLLVIQGQRDDIARPDADGGALATAAGPFGELWLVPGATHVNARRAEPREYEERVLGFLGLHLGD